jgi:hypothetical protein
LRQRLPPLAGWRSPFHGGVDIERTSRVATANVAGGTASGSRPARPAGQVAANARSRCAPARFAGGVSREAGSKAGSIAMARREPTIDGGEKIVGRIAFALIAPERALRERVRCSSLIDWPVYPRLRGTMQGSTRCRNKPHAARADIVSACIGGCRHWWGGKGRRVPDRRNITGCYIARRPQGQARRAFATWRRQAQGPRRRPLEALLALPASSRAPPIDLSRPRACVAARNRHQERRRRLRLVGAGLVLGLASTVSRLGVKAAARSASLSSGHRSRTILTVRSTGVSGGRS